MARIVKRTQTGPAKIEIPGGQPVFICQCGLSKSQPRCDGSHKTTDITPQKFTITATEKKWLCGCKASKNKPFCDGSHKAL